MLGGGKNRAACHGSRESVRRSSTGKNVRAQSQICSSTRPRAAAEPPESGSVPPQIPRSRQVHLSLRPPPEDHLVFRTLPVSRSLCRCRFASVRTPPPLPPTSRTERRQTPPTVEVHPRRRLFRTVQPLLE